ncbi:MAG: NlpC/P60 family protein [Pseudomonadota bacterium]
MSEDGARLAKAATALIGVPFRLHGRNPLTGLDCVGLVAASLEAIGIQPSAPRGYHMRNASIEQWLDCARRSGLEPSDDQSRIGDIVLVAPGPGQSHLLIVDSPKSVIHAHAGLRRVVCQPLDHSLKPNSSWRVMPRPKDT